MLAKGRGEGGGNRTISQKSKLISRRIKGLIFPVRVVKLSDVWFNPLKFVFFFISLLKM